MTGAGERCPGSYKKVLEVPPQTTMGVRVQCPDCGRKVGLVNGGMLTKHAPTKAITITVAQAREILEALVLIPDPGPFGTAICNLEAWIDEATS